MRLVLLLSLLCLLPACDRDGEDRQVAPAGTTASGIPPEHILAGISAGDNGPRPEPGHLRELLNAIAARCSNDPREITAAIVDIKAILIRRGIEISTVELMQRLESNIPEQEGGYDFALVADAFRRLSTDAPGGN